MKETDTIKTILINRYISKNIYTTKDGLFEMATKKLYADLLRYLKKTHGYIFKQDFTFDSLKDLDNVFTKVLNITLENASLIRKYYLGGINSQLEYSVSSGGKTSKLTILNNKDDKTKYRLRFWGYGYEM